MQKNVTTKFFTMIIASCLTLTFFTGCQQVVEEKTYYLNTYTVEFDANGGSGTMKSQTFSQNKEQQLSKNAFEARTEVSLQGGPQIQMLFLMNLNTKTLNLSP